MSKFLHRASGKGKQHCSCKCHWDMSWLTFGETNISVTDVDGLFVVERHRQFLFIETKDQDEPLTEGQRIMLQQLSCVPGFTVWLLRGPKGYPTIKQTIHNGKLVAEQTVNRNIIQSYVDIWFSMANEGNAA